MFDIGFSELGVIGVIALIVIGPEQLPRVARTTGHVLGRLRRYVSDVKADIGREMELADLKRLQDEVQDAARSLETSLREHATSVESELQQSIATSELHELASSVVTEVNAAIEPHAPQTTATPEVSASEPEAPPLEVDPNQMDLFGAPTPTESTEKH